MLGLNGTDLTIKVMILQRFGDTLYPFQAATYICL